MAALAKPFSYTLSDYNAKEDKIAPILMILTITHLGDKAKIFTAEGIFNDKKTAVKITGNSKANSMLGGTFKKKGSLTLTVQGGGKITALIKTVNKKSMFTAASLSRLFFAYDRLIKFW